ncbi:MAG: ABC transporter ATP-binding protein [Elusimicrobia bacterium HGW-Elusimicrobia-1]|jgi:phospholipid/cholesterol/gamma-HCH transport system ATP-binding protein|nr:MAG: ABC transporter ATP-binding protein [Elusimicrobia bacterium HGW-Elusimicrobia-1]
MIKISGVHKSFNSNHVLRGTSLDILDGETITIIGASGGGKSVLLKCMVGLLQVDDGDIFADEHRITGLEDDALWEVQKKFGFLFQGAALFDSLTVAENIAFGLKNLRPDISGNEVSQRVRWCLENVGLKNIEHLKPAELSGGMKKRVGLARAIATEPKYILYDEPTTGLDPIKADLITDLILKLQHNLKITSIVVTHDMVAAYKVSNRVAMLYDGKIVEIGSPDEIKNTRNEIVRQFIEGHTEEKV